MSAIAASFSFTKAVAGKSVASSKARGASKRGAAFKVSATSRVDACDKNSIIVSPSILSANFAVLGEQVPAL